MQSTFRFAVGTPMGLSTNSWRAWVGGQDVYVKCRDNFNEVKASLHASGTWRFGFTQEFVNSRPDMLPEGRDRAWSKCRPSFADPSKAVIGFQIVVLKGSTYLDASKRRSWPPSVVFVEPPQNDERMTVVSVCVAKTRSPVRMATGTYGVAIGILPLEDDWSAQVVATHEQVGTMQDSILDAFRKAVVAAGGKDKMPAEGVFFVHGTRGEDVPWISAVRFTKAAASG
jgi:hypothetical protein